MPDDTPTAKTTHELIVYACPTGELAAQLRNYFDTTRAAVGANTAHRYMSHISLTGFFHDQQSAFAGYATALQNSLQTVMAWGADGDRTIHIAGMRFQDAFHYLQIDSPWLTQLSVEFARTAESATRIDAVRVKDFLHLSLAYGFELQHGMRLAQFARELVNYRSQVGWQLHFYERHAGDLWTLHKSWTLL